MEIDIILNEFTSPQQAVELGLMAENYGVRGVWSSNYGWSRDPFMALSLLADRSSRIRLGPMAVSAEELHPLKMANLLFSLNEMSRGRAMIMVGAGGAVLQAIGKERGRMIRSVRECLEILKGSSPDKTMNYDGEMYKVWGYKPEYATDEPPLIYYGSNHPQSRRVAAELADGLITSDFVVPLMKEFVDATYADLEAAGRSPADFRISNFWAWHIKEDAEASVREARRELMLRGWLGEQYFAPFLDADEVKLMRDHEHDFLNAFLRSTDVIENVPDDLVTKMIENISFVGGLDQIDAAIETLHAFADAGLTEIALRVHDDPVAAIRLIGERVMPAMR
ncbi:MAG: LLM class flavin-dependent oxidoreductase [Gammaproteobacteria bacterium]|nr:LLM class flavin-dependent oxidoreductase [Gammaproteobacteria bacterium]MBT8444981.1 LLM class flavin-dependent oxidoreductase [Gammaproteobacteria bacterium]NND37168.1 LLM class flavin-dependent oxidoreductase [Gammaproteobacteria bacterium]